MIDPTKITPDLDFPDHDYYPFYYKGFRAEQNPYIFQALDAFAANPQVYPRMIIEIGSRNGGFTKILEDHPLSDHALIYSWDICDFPPDGDEPFTRRTQRFVGDCFQEVITIGSLIRKAGQTLVFCDGGDKNREINVFSKYLKSGDFIFGHDYAPDKETWEREFKDKKWDWFETWDSAIADAEKENGLVPFCQEEMGKAVWKCLTKL